MSLVKLKSTGRIGHVVESTAGGQHKTVLFQAEGNECTRTKAKGFTQVIRAEKLEDYKD